MFNECLFHLYGCTCSNMMCVLNHMLGSIGRSQGWQMNMELVAGSGMLDKTRFREALLEYELGRLRYSG